VTNAQYVAFLNAKAASDPLGLYNTRMEDLAPYGGITRSGSSGSYTYTPVVGRETMPVNFVSFYDALRFANWLNNGGGSGDTETGTYTLLGGTASPSNGTTVTRNAGGNIFLTSEGEWYKAAYYDPPTSSYFDYPAGTDAPTACTTPGGATANTANCSGAVGNLTSVGSYIGSASPNGSFDQGGNVIEWNETRTFLGTGRGVRGGSFEDDANGPNYLAASNRIFFAVESENRATGFRLAMIPEPSTGVLVVAGLLGFASWRRGAQEADRA
jgi:formylglycine-generating enzyme